jgi:hypothetical protein
LSRSLDRLGTVAVPGSGRHRARRRRRPLALVLAVVPVAAASLSWLGSAWSGPDDDPPPGAAVPPTGEDPGAGEPRELAAPDVSVAAPTTGPLGRFEELELWLPSASPVVVGYHEAATVAALGIDPVGLLTEDRNTTRTSLPADDRAGGAYLVLSSRGRSAAPTSAIDVVLREDEPVLSPVTGTVVDVRSYLLYGAHQDLRVEVVPDARPDLRLVLIHLDDVAVGIGDHVAAGVTPLAATARSFPFGSHIDRETEPERHPHVHLELQRLGAPRPGDDAQEGADRDDAADGPGVAARG